MTKKIKYNVYKILKENGSQTRINDFVEYFISIVIILNVLLIVVESINQIADYHQVSIRIIRNVFFIFFLVEYILRLWIADIASNNETHPFVSRIRYIITFRAIIDLLALFPVMLGLSFIDFRVFRILRLLRITQLKGLNQYTNVFVRVIQLKGTQLLSSFFIVLIFMLVSAIVIYDIENPAQPDVFKNVLVSLWWSISAITTVGYGDIYPITAFGRTLGAFISVFGVFVMAIPIGILTAGFFEVSKSMENEKEENKNISSNSN